MLHLPKKTINKLTPKMSLTKPFDNTPLRPVPSTLKQGEINKLIIANPIKKDRSTELIGPYNRYRDENVAIYKDKMKGFSAAVEKCRELNKECLVHSKERIGGFDLDGMDVDFEKDVPDNELPVDPDLGLRVRKRIVRRIHTENAFDYQSCSLEPWFKRYLVLNKFIQAGRKVILYNRLVKNLQLLKSVSEESVNELSKKAVQHDNRTYAELFEPFLNNL